MFAGSYEHSVDSKGRISVPKRFHRELSDGLVLAKGFEKCIILYPLEEWNRVSSSMIDLPGNHANSRRLRRGIFSTAFPSELDGQGRVVLPSPLREHAAIGDLAIVLGVGSYLEIWDKDLLSSENALIEGELARIAETIELPQ